VKAAIRGAHDVTRSQRGIRNMKVRGAYVMANAQRQEVLVSKRRSIRFRRFVRAHVAPFVLTLLVLGSFRSSVADWNVVPSGSMNPTIVEGDRIFVNKLAYGLRVPFTSWYVAHWSDPKRGDVITFASPADGVRLVKRVIGLPGETVELVDDHLFINGQPATYTPSRPASGGQVFATEVTSAGAHPIVVTPARPALRNFGPVTVPAGHYFVMGDNRDNSADSRYFGFVPRDSITGRSSSVVLSFDPATHLPRGDRTLQTLP
jgi:signal peptidase I